MKDDPIWNIYRSEQPKAHDTPPASLPNPSHDMEYASYCEGVAAQLAGNSNIPTASTASHRQIAAHALGRLDVRHGADIMTLTKLSEVLDKLFTPLVEPSVT